MEPVDEDELDDAEEVEVELEEEKLPAGSAVCAADGPAGWLGRFGLGVDEVELNDAEEVEAELGEDKPECCWLGGVSMFEEDKNTAGSTANAADGPACWLAYASR